MADDGTITLFEYETTSREDREIGIRIVTCPTDHCDGLHLHLDGRADGVTQGWAPIATFHPNPGAAIPSAAFLADLITMIAGLPQEKRMEIAETLKPRFEEFQNRVLDNAAIEATMREAAEMQQRGDVH